MHFTHHHDHRVMSEREKPYDFEWMDIKTYECGGICIIVSGDGIINFMLSGPDKARELGFFIKMIRKGEKSVYRFK